MAPEKKDVFSIKGAIENIKKMRTQKGNPMSWLKRRGDVQEPLKNRNGDFKN